jgi:membrane fusion protein, multidrug efflux system
MNDSPPDPTPLTATQRQRSRSRLILLVLVPLGAAAITLFVYLRGGREVETDNAYVKATKIPISTEVAGTVKEVLVRENQAVTSGQVLFRLDPAGFQVAVAQAQARLAQVRADLAALAASYRHNQAEVALARTRLGYARQEQQRQADLVARGFVSNARFDDARLATELAARQIDVLEQEQQRIAAMLGGGIETRVERHPSYLAALAELDRARLDLARVDVRALQPGTVTKPPQPGYYIAAGAAPMALVVTAKPWVEANFIETDLAHVHPGQRAVVTIDTFPDAQLHGTVESLSPATGAEFSLIPAQNATGNWVKITQRLPVRIRLDAAADRPELRAGLSATVRIETGQRRRLLGWAWPG